MKNEFHEWLAAFLTANPNPSYADTVQATREAGFSGEPHMKEISRMMFGSGIRSFARLTPIIEEDSPYYMEELEALARCREAVLKMIANIVAG